jgi:outer membrane receptor protein involved in Fe transport
MRLQFVKLIIMLMLGVTMVFAGQTGKIAGQVIDKDTGEPLIGANVVITGKWEGEEEVPLEQPYGASTDVDGSYFILNLPPGEYTVEVIYTGYATMRITKVGVSVDKTTRLDFQLTSEVIAGKAIDVVAYKPESVEKDVTATKVSYNVGDVQDLPGVTDIGDILNLQADVDGGHFRGGRTGEALYMVNGSSIVNPLTNSQSFEPMTIGLEQVEVYTSGFSAEYGNVQSGVINMVAKEGRSDDWETKFDISSTNSYYKTFGGSVYSPEYNDYFTRLNNTEEWAFGTDPISGAILWTHFGLGFERYLPKPPIVFPPQPLSREDSLRTAELIRILWLQSVRQIGLEYDKPDYRMEFSTSGPIAENTTFFVAAQQQVVQPFLPTGRSNISRQVSSNVTFKPGTAHKFQVIYQYSSGFNNAITSDYFRWFENVLNVTKQISSAHQIGINWNYVISPSTFLDVKFGQLYTNDEEKIDLLGDSTFTELYTNSINWRDYTAPTGYQVGKMQTTSGFERTKTFSLNSSLTSQIDNHNMFKGGIQFNYYDIHVDYLRSRSNLSQVRSESYHKYPYEGAIYLQDKIEFEGLIANVGSRLDFYNFNTEYYLNKFSPYKNPNFDPTDPSSGSFYDPELAAKEKTDLQTFFQPRIGISFPVSEKSVLHLNYGVFVQRPPFERIFTQRLKFDANPNYEWLGNPQLEPEQTISYDLGLVYGLPLGFYLDVSAYLKDVTNLLQFAVYQDLGGNRYFTFDNREYANIKGFQVNLEKNLGMFRGYIRYNWESAKGKSGSAIGSGARAEFFEDDNLPDLLPSPKDVFLDYNRLHKLVANLRIKTRKGDGFTLFGVKPLENVAVSGTYRLASGRPFTYDPTGQGLQMNQRTPTEHDLKLRLDKMIKVNDTNLKFYMEAFNVLNHKVLSYSRTFEDPQGEQNIFKIRYMEDRENLLIQKDFAPYFTSLDAYLYSNQPRHYRFGLEVEF